MANRSDRDWGGKGYGGGRGQDESTHHGRYTKKGQGSGKGPHIDRDATTCANCGRDGHTLAVCYGPTNANGSLDGCPICNTKTHRYDRCSFRKARQDAHFILQLRNKKPPLSIPHDWREMFPNWSVLYARPLLPLSLQTVREFNEQILGWWENHHYPRGGVGEILFDDRYWDFSKPDLGVAERQISNNSASAGSRLPVIDLRNAGGFPRPTSSSVHGHGQGRDRGQDQSRAQTRSRRHSRSRSRTPKRSDRRSDRRRYSRSRSRTRASVVVMNNMDGQSRRHDREHRHRSRRHRRSPSTSSSSDDRRSPSPRRSKPRGDRDRDMARRSRSPHRSNTRKDRGRDRDRRSRSPLPSREAVGRNVRASDRREPSSHRVPSHVSPATLQSRDLGDAMDVDGFESDTDFNGIPYSDSRRRHTRRDDAYADNDATRGRTQRGDAYADNDATRGRTQRGDAYADNDATRGRTQRGDAYADNDATRGRTQRGDAYAENDAAGGGRTYRQDSGHHQEEPLRMGKHTVQVQAVNQSEPTYHQSAIECHNCGYDHVTSDCPDGCGYCGEDHLAPQCPNWDKACRCQQYPGHILENCWLPCGHCGTQAHTAVRCPTRCCICGGFGHTALGCFRDKDREKDCRCGQFHFGMGNHNDSCRGEAPGQGRKKECGQYLCNTHCKGCGANLHLSIVSGSHFPSQSGPTCPYTCITPESATGNTKAELKCTKGHRKFRFGLPKGCPECLQEYNQQGGTS